MFYQLTIIQLVVHCTFQKSYNKQELYSFITVITVSSIAQLNKTKKKQSLDKRKTYIVIRQLEMLLTPLYRHWQTIWDVHVEGQDGEALKAVRSNPRTHLLASSLAMRLTSGPLWRLGQFGPILSWFRLTCGPSNITLVLAHDWPEVHFVTCRVYFLLN